MPPRSVISITVDLPAMTVEEFKSLVEKEIAPADLSWYLTNSVRSSHEGRLGEILVFRHSLVKLKFVDFYVHPAAVLVDMDGPESMPVIAPTPFYPGKQYTKVTITSTDDPDFQKTIADNFDVLCRNVRALEDALQVV